MRPRARLRAGANDADHVALSAGLKPMLRELTASHAWPAQRARLQASGLRWRLLEQTVQADSAGGRVRASATGGRRIVLIGHDDRALDEALALETAMLAEPPSDRSLVARLARLLGYPDCCGDAFAALQAQSNLAAVSAAAARTERFEPLLNNVQLSLPRHVPWFPCRYDCPASLQYARAVDGLLPASWREVRVVQRMPRLFLDDRRQVIVAGRPLPDGVSVVDAFTPCALDGRRDAIEAEWSLHNDLAAPIAEGDRLVVSAEALDVSLGGRALCQLERPAGSVWLPWGGP